MKILILTMLLVSCGKNFKSEKKSEIIFLSEENYTYCTAFPEGEFCDCLNKVYSFTCNKYLNGGVTDNFLNCLAEQNESINENQCNNL